jgi:hypothetical protein
VRSYADTRSLVAVPGARVPAEFGHDPGRYADAKARKNYSGMSPITKASGTKQVVLAQFARNRRLGDALFLQAFATLNIPRRPRVRGPTALPKPPLPSPPEPVRTDSSASSTAACEPTISTTNTSANTTNQTNSARRLDCFQWWDV